MSWFEDLVNSPGAPYLGAAIVGIPLGLFIRRRQAIRRKRYLDEGGTFKFPASLRGASPYPKNWAQGSLTVGDGKLEFQRWFRKRRVVHSLPKVAEPSLRDREGRLEKFLLNAGCRIIVLEPGRLEIGVRRENVNVTLNACTAVTANDAS